MAWWRDVDGRGTPIDDWMRETVAPLLLVLGCLDVCLDHPKAPPGEKIATRADELRLGLDRCVASYILPQNMVWWRLDSAGRYLECLVREYIDPSDRVDYDKSGNAIDPEDPGNTRRSLASELRAVAALAARRVDPLQLRRRRDPGAGPAPVRPRPDRPAGRPPQAPDPAYRQVPVRSDRRVPARVLQPGQRADPLRYAAGPPVPVRGGRLLQERQHALGRPGLHPADEEERRNGTATRVGSSSARPRTRPSRCGGTSTTSSR